MNFDFIKNLEGLNKAFSSCNNAEELAKSMPDLSMVASRKSAEVIAKLVYLIANAEQVEELTFADILSDYSVKRYLGDRSVLDAFHFIRKNGNTAVHTLKQESPDTAIAVLKQLHYVVGEVARRMKLIRNYPSFNPNIDVNPKATLSSIEDTGKMAREMYDDFVISQKQATRFLEEFRSLASPIQLIAGDVDLNERLEFARRPEQKSTASKIQEHFGYLALQALRYLQQEDPEREIVFKATITLKGDDGYTTTTTSDLIGFMNALMYDLPKSNGFIITTSYYGPSVAPWFNSEVQETFQKTVEKLGEQEKFTYMYFEFLYSHGAGHCGKYKNGTWLELEKTVSEKILDFDYGQDWWCWNQDLSVEFDYEKHPDIIEALHHAVRKHIPEDQLDYCEGTWEDGDVGILCSSISWTPRKLRVVQDFLDEINRILLPVKQDCVGYGLGDWYIPEAPFVVATWEWSENGFGIVGVEL